MRIHAEFITLMFWYSKFKNLYHGTGSKSSFVSVGDVITRDSGFMRGHGTYMTDDVLYASVAGVVERVNKLISVTPLKTRSEKVDIFREIDNLKNNNRVAVTFTGIAVAKAL